MSGIFDQVINYAPPSLLKGTVTYKGTWSAATNTPTLINPPDSTTNGHYYVVSAAGTQFSLVFNIGDWIISNGSAWEKVDNTDAVSSVFGRTGAVVGVSTDYSAVGIANTAIGLSNPSTGAFTTLSATTPLAATSGGTGLSSLGTGVATFLGTPTSANLAAAVTNETGSGSLVFGTSPTITTPVIAQINDANGNETLKLASIASAVNEVTIENAPSGSAVHISATGGDASVGLHLAGKGASGYVNVQDSTDATKRLMFNAAGGTTNTRTMLSSTQTVDRTLSLPDATDTLVGKATTDTLTNKTITGGILNGTLGATTPSTGAFTTLAATGNISTTGGDVLIRGAAGGQITQNGGAGGLYIANTGTSTAMRLLVTNGAAASVTALTLAADSGAASFASNVAITGTLSATGQITSTVASGTVTLESTAPYGTGYKAIRLGNTGSTLTVGVESSAGGSLLTSATGYAGVVSSNSTILQLGASNTIVATLSSGAAAITGALSATGQLTVTGAAQNPFGSTFTPTAWGTSSVDINHANGGILAVYYGGTAKGYFIANSGTGAISLNTQGDGTINQNVNGTTRASVTSTGLAVTGVVTASLAKIGTGFAGIAEFTNTTDFGAAGTYSFLSEAAGLTYINAKSGQSITLRIANSEKANISSTGLAVTGALSCTGALSKGSGSFRIEHPLPSKSATHQLVHSFIEGPKCDLIYRGKINLVDGKASVNIDTDSTMTEGTFEVLCANVQCFTSNESGWGAIRGVVVGNILTIEAQDAASTDNVSWMVIGERKDPHIMDTDWTDDNGRPIVEPLKPAEPALES